MAFLGAVQPLAFMKQSEPKQCKEDLVQSREKFIETAQKYSDEFETTEKNIKKLFDGIINETK